ncbi:MAG: PQQ-dependent sugar dehydrogenase [Armatimonadetes bacterium]|nr:PQQ-dependent sugar dehydrogenase [Armatimonadota bacterium]
MNTSKLLPAALGAASLFTGASAQTLVDPDYFVETYASGLSGAVGMEFLSASTVLVTQKDTGQVRVVVNGVVDGTPALDLPVNNASERGLLGICKHPDFAKNGFVYLYWSRSTTGGDTGVSANWSDNRVERYVYNSGTLSLDSLIAIFSKDPAQNNGPNHDGGVIMIGPDQKLYIITGDLNRNRAEQNNQGTPNLSAKVGGVHRLNLDGTIPGDNPFVGLGNTDFHPYYVYGVRNSYGMSWDPLTSKIWFTENGPGSYDEVNHVPTPGMNSGWNELMGPDSRDPQGVGDLVMFTGAYYRDPEFSWLTPIAVTSIAWLTSSKFHGTERTHCVIGDANNGFLYLFQMNLARDGFVLSGGVADKVADSSAERDLNKWGSGFGITTDLEIGQDGYLYGTSLTLGRIFRIRPVVESVVPTSFSLFRGVLISGNLQSLSASDDNRLVTRPGPVFTNAEAPIQLILTSTSPFVAPSALSFKIESNCSVSNITQSVALYNFNTMSYETLNTGTAMTSDSTITINVSSDAARFIGPDNELRARISYKAQGTTFIYPWHSRIDHVQWTLTR